MNRKPLISVQFFKFYMQSMHQAFGSFGNMHYINLGEMASSSFLHLLIVNI